MTEPQSLKARTHIEREHDIQRNLLEAGEIDFLPDTVVEDLEIGRSQPLDRTPALGDQHVDSNGFNPAREDGLRDGLGGRRAERGEEDG